MARRCGCASDSCSCVVMAGDGIQVHGSGSEQNPYVVTSLVTDIVTGIDVQKDNVNVALNVHRLDFRGTAVTVTPGSDEAIISVVATGGGSGDTTPIASVIMYAMPIAPTGWLPCDGRTVLIADWPDLFAIIGTTYGGNGTSNFIVPDMRGHFPIGTSPTYPLNGVPTGTATRTLSVANLPPHSHNMNHSHTTPSHTHPGLETDGDALQWKNDLLQGGTTSGLYLTGENPVTVRAGGGGLVTPSISTTTTGTGDGLGTPVDITPPYLALTFIIKAAAV